MAEGFAERLPLTEGTNRVIADEANPSGMGALLEFTGQALEGYQQIKKDVAANKARKKAEQEKATQAQIAYDVTGSNDAARQVVAESGAVRAQGQATLNQFTEQAMEYGAAEVDRQGAALSDTIEDKLSPFYVPPADITPAMEREVNASAQRAASVMTAVEQGRMPEISMNAALSARFRQLREKYPEHTEYLLDTWKKAGLDSNIFSEARDAALDVADARSAANKARDVKLEMRNKAIAMGRETLGAAALTMSDDDLEINGLETMRIQGEVQRSIQKADLQIKVAAGSEAAVKTAQEDLTHSIDTNMAVAVYNQSLPIIRSIGGLVDSLSRNPGDSASLIEFQRQGPMVAQLVDQVVNNAVLQAQSVPNYRGDPEKLRTTLRNQLKGLTDAFTGDHSVVASNVAALRSVETAFAIDGHKALPVFMGLKQLGIKPDAMPGLMKAVETNPALQKSLNAEINGYLTDWGKDRASTALVNVVKLLRGETTFARMDATAARTALPILQKTADGIASAYVAGKDIDPDTVLNAFGEITIAATALTPSSGSRAMYVATRGFADGASRAALVKAFNDPNLPAEDKEMALATIQASRATSAHMLNNIRLASFKANDASPYFKMVWDKNDGKYKLDRSGLQRAIVQARSNAGSLRGAGAGLETGSRRLGVLQSMQPPEVITQLIKSANMNLDNAVELGRLDPSTPKANENQLRNWYGQEKPLPREADNSKPINPQKELNKQIDALRAMTTQTFDAATKPVESPGTPGGPGERRERSKRGTEIVVPAIATMEEKQADNPIYGAFKTAASKYGIPTDVALRLGWVEGKFKPQGTNSVGASGPAQVRGYDPSNGKPVHDTESMKRYGKRVRDLTPEENVDFGMHILKREYDKSGSWRTAVKRYLGAEKGDANLTGEQYANLIF